MRKYKLQRQRIFFGCEGQSEQAYAALLQKINDGRRRDLYFATTVLSGGDPLTLVNRAKRAIEKIERTKEPFDFRALLLDSDLQSGKPKSSQQSIELAAEIGLRLIWQEPCHEAFLLRHLPGCAKSRPKTTTEAIAKLKVKWPVYKKNMTSLSLGSKITFEGIVQASTVETALCAFFLEIGFI
ncbi:MAG: RloB domain-containing protein [Candidatus Melainabacteria bacterium]|nr:RloB domain-containing protein [Candidatus Melainabacteria bacterium]